MTREWVDEHLPAPRRGPDTRDKRWVMRCDARDEQGRRCTTSGPPGEALPRLEEYRDAGWFIAQTFGDTCPACLGAGYEPTAPAHVIMLSRPLDSTPRGAST